MGNASTSAPTVSSGLAASTCFTAPLKELGGDLSWGFITSNREGGIGDDDIYSFSRHAATLEVYVFDAQTEKPLIGATVWPLVTGPDGRFKFRLDKKNCCYTLRVETEGVIPAVAEGICTKSQTLHAVQRINLNLEPYRDREGFIAEIPDRAILTTGPRYKERTCLYENAHGSLTTFEPFPAKCTGGGRLAGGTRHCRKSAHPQRVRRNTPGEPLWQWSRLQRRTTSAQPPYGVQNPT